MPVLTSIPLRNFNQEDFGSVAYEVVGHAFQIHEALGKRFRESVYRSAIQRVLGIRATEEMQIVLSHADYRKELFIDLIVDSGCPFELKVAASLNDVHESQLIQYLMLTGLSHGKLINFGGENVEHKFINCHESQEQRRDFSIERSDWFEDRPGRKFENLIVPLVRDWGTGLTRTLYHEAVIAILGGETCRRFTETFWHERAIGHQPVEVIENQIAFDITCKRKNIDLYESHLRRFLVNTTLDSILWANIVSGCVRLQRISRG